MLKNKSNPKTQRIRDRAYLDSFKNAMCWNCGVSDETVVGAHIRVGGEGGMGYKPSDDLVIPLCFPCHQEFDANHSSLWLGALVKNMARRRYEGWKETEKLIGIRK